MECFRIFAEREKVMWKCPKCERDFKKMNQPHYCGKKPSSIDEYIEMQDVEIRTHLIQVRNAIREAIPEAQERISWSMPTYWKNCNLIQFAANKNHLGLYPGPKAVEYFSDQLAEYKFSKDSIQLPYKKGMPIELIKRIALWCYPNK